MGKGNGFIGKVEETWVPSSVFGSDTRSVGCTYGGLYAIKRAQQNILKKKKKCMEGGEEK